MSSPAASLVGTLLSVATPLLFVTPMPTNAPSSVKRTICPLMPRPVDVEVSVAVRTAGPPTGAVPATNRVVDS